MSDRMIDRILSYPRLPSLPTVAVEVLELARRPDPELDEIARVVEHDQALCARILRTVNSSFYGLPTPCSTITRALTYLGLSTVKSLVLGFNLVDCQRSIEEGFDLVDHWRRCIYSAAAARTIARRFSTCDPETAFVGALMQDIGMLAMHTALGAKYQPALAAAEGDHETLHEHEARLFGVDHAEIGARLCERWRLATELVNAVRFHHRPDEAPKHQKLVRTIVLSRLLAATLPADGEGHSADSVASAQSAELGTRNADAMERFRQKAVEWLSIGPEVAEELLDGLPRQARELSTLLEVNIGEEGGPANVGAIMERAEEASLEHQVMMEREHRALREQASCLTKLALTDELTGTANRRHFQAEFARWFTNAKAFHGCLAVVMVDADLFKSTNDANGHQIGDAALVELARRLQEQIDMWGGGNRGLLCRYGGDEFAVILPGADRRVAATVAEKMRRSVEACEFDIADAQGSRRTLALRVSIGVAALEPEVYHRIVSPQLLLAAADKALYAAKSSGRNCVRVFSVRPAMAA